jgi:hypothetical protein
MLQCYDSVTDGSDSRWSFHTACIDPIAPAPARCRKNFVVRRREEAAGGERAVPRNGALKRWLADRRRSRLSYP